MVCGAVLVGKLSRWHAIRRPYPALCTAQPERDLARLHGLLHDGDQLFMQGVQIHLLPQRGAEGGYHFTGIVLPAIEAMVDKVLKTVPQRLEKGRNCQRRGDDDQWLFLRQAAGHGLHQRLQRQDETDIDAHLLPV
jgi:hypothetical protein